MALDGAALIAEIEALESEQDSTGEVTGILSRLDPVTCQVGHLGSSDTGLLMSIALGACFSYRGYEPTPCAGCARWPQW